MEENELAMRAGAFVSKIVTSQPNAHAYRIRSAFLAMKALENFIQDEVHAAQSHRRGSDSYLSWAQIGKAVEVSRTAAYTRYHGRGKDEGN